MKTRLTLKPGQKGTKKLLRQYGDTLVCVRYRYDEAARKRYKTVEIIVEEIEWPVKSPVDDFDNVIGIKVHWGEKDLARRVRNAGGVWNPHQKVWLLARSAVERLGLTDRIVDTKRHLHTDAAKLKSI